MGPTSSFGAERGRGRHQSSGMHPQCSAGKGREGAAIRTAGCTLSAAQGREGKGREGKGREGKAIRAAGCALFPDAVGTLIVIAKYCFDPSLSHLPYCLAPLLLVPPPSRHLQCQPARIQCRDHRHALQVRKRKGEGLNLARRGARQDKHHGDLLGLYLLCLGAALPCPPTPLPPPPHTHTCLEMTERSPSAAGRGASAHSRRSVAKASASICCSSGWRDSRSPRTS